jgi:hypothetical protein
MPSFMPKLFSDYTDAAYICFPAFQKFIGQPVGKAIDEFDFLQAIALEKGIGYGCILKGNPGKATLLKRAVFNSTS